MGTEGVVEVAADEGGLCHDGNAFPDASVELIEGTHEVHVSADEEQLLGEVESVFH